MLFFRFMKRNSNKTSRILTFRSGTATSPINGGPARKDSTQHIIPAKTKTSQKL